MELGEKILAGMFSPVILFFLLGIVTVLVKAGLEIPPAMNRFLAIFLMVSIGLRGGVKAVQALEVAPGLLGVIAGTAALAILGGVFFAFSTANILRRAGLKTADAWAAGGHYGAVCSALLGVGIGVASAAQEAAAPGSLVFAGWMPAMYPFMDSPALVTAIIFGRRALAEESATAGIKTDIRKILHHSLFGMAVWLLVCSLLIGMLAQTFSPRMTESTLRFFDGMFPGMLVLFMIDMGMTAGGSLGALKEIGRDPWRIVLIAFGLPQVWGLLGILGLFGIHSLMPGMIGWGDAFVFATIAAGCSFVTAPVAMRIAIPEASPSVYLPMSVALTFPFNLIVGMPLWRIVTMALWGA